MKTALAKNHFLQELNLAGTGLDSSAAITLAECLPENSTLSRLDLTRNPHIDMAGVLALSISIKMNHTLTFLDINIPVSHHPKIIMTMVRLNPFFFILGGRS